MPYKSPTTPIRRGMRKPFNPRNLIRSIMNGWMPHWSIRWKPSDSGPSQNVKHTESLIAKTIDHMLRYFCLGVFLP